MNVCKRRWWDVEGKMGYAGGMGRRILYTWGGAGGPADFARGSTFGIVSRHSPNIDILGRRPIGLDVTDHRKTQFTKKEGVSDRLAVQTGASRSMSQEGEGRFVERETFIFAFVPRTSYS